MSHPQNHDGDDDIESVQSASPSIYTTAQQTASEIHPDDSVSNRNLVRNRRWYGGGGSDIVIEESESGSQANESPSVASLHSSAPSNLYKQVGGRIFNTQSDVYQLPADDEEHLRLDIQHYALALWMNRLYPFASKVERIVAEDRDPPAEILDVGTGSGRWAVDMCNAYPWINIVGIDIVPPVRIPREQIPLNLRFEIDDANLSMEHYAETFDFVHARMIEAALNDTESFTYEMARVLKPGGLFVMCSADVQLFDEHRVKRTFCERGQSGFSWVQYTLGHVYRAYISRGGVGANGVLWEREWLESNPNFTGVSEEEVWIPLGPWRQGLNDREILAANFMREDIARAFVSFRPLLTACGYDPEDINLWVEEATKELRDTSKPSYVRFRYLGATRTDQPWQERGMTTTPEDLTTRSRIQGVDLTRPWVRPGSVS